ncbi:small acid-soluble spore protein H [Radiobacillus sp. PE A8.2]|uniref:small acid-soluble spore protein H n=1 Tax=Radiobacillus sp. PE A8.2 TaxID=3380349 RepID=UPI00388FFCF9
MNIQRAKEIVESPVMINVMYEGNPIYIQHVDEQENTARIFPVDEPEQEKSVPLDSLKEH